MLVQRIDPEELKTLSASSKMNAEWDFLLHLYDIGFRREADWLAQNYGALGKESIVNMRAMFACEIIA